MLGSLPVQTMKLSSYGHRTWKRFKASWDIQHSSLQSSPLDLVYTSQVDRTDRLRYGRTRTANKPFSSLPQFGHWLQIPKMAISLQDAQMGTWESLPKTLHEEQQNSNFQHSTRKSSRLQLKSQAWAKTISRSCHWPVTWVIYLLNFRKLKWQEGRRNQSLQRRSESISLHVARRSMG